MKKEIKQYALGDYLEYTPTTLAPIGLILYLHGNGERGSDVTLLEKNEIPKQCKDPDFEVPFIIICPQLPLSENGWFKNSLLAAKKITDEINLPKHGTGISLGGIGTVLFMSLFPGYFETAGIVCGKDNFRDFTDYAKVKRIRAWHGLSDTTCKPGTIVTMITELQGKTDATIKTYPGRGHNIWPDAYAYIFTTIKEDETYWQWMGVKEPDVEEPLPTPTPQWHLDGIATGVTKPDVKEFKFH